MTDVLGHAVDDTHAAAAVGGKIFITRHGERADLADERWLAQAEVGLTMHLFDCKLCSTTVCTQVADDPPLTEQGLQQAYELGRRLQVAFTCSITTVDLWSV